MRNTETDPTEFVCACVRENRVHDFYVWRVWKKKRRQVLEQDRYECQECKKHGRYSRAVVVHHVKHLRKHPELALCDTFLDSQGREQRQLVSVCRECHETVCHPERMGRKPQRERFCPPESWE